jgi:hypothetical protein
MHIAHETLDAPIATIGRENGHELMRATRWNDRIHDPTLNVESESPITRAAR